jgi:hypothetical protein
LLELLMVVLRQRVAIRETRDRIETLLDVVCSRIYLVKFII